MKPPVVRCTKACNRGILYRLNRKRDSRHQPIVEKYQVKEIYLFGSYARGEATADSDVDFSVYGGEKFRLTMIFALAEELRETLKKNVDVFEIYEINENSTFYNTIMEERVLVV